MKAVIYTTYGSTEVLKIKDISKPVPKSNELLIKIHAATVNRTDCGFLSGKPFLTRLFSGLFAPKAPVLGNEFAGEVEAIGKAVGSFKTGDKVFGYNDKTFGAHAEYMVIDEDAPVTTMPANMTYVEAAPIIEGAHYALCNLKAAKIKKGQKLLVNGATGGIGSAAVQLGVYFGAEVTAVCNTKNIALVSAIGAREVIDYTKQDFTKLQQTFDVVFDAVGKSSFKQCKPLLKHDGIYLSTELGKRAENIFLALMAPVIRGKKVLFPIPTISKEDVVFFKQLIEAGKYKSVIDRHYSLDQIAAAYKYVQTGQKIGNVIITINHNEVKLADDWLKIYASHN